MTFSEVKELLAAGFTHDEIMQFSTESTGFQQPMTSQQEAAADDPEPAPADPEVKPAADAASQEPDMFNQLNDTMNRLIKTIQSSNLKNNSFDKQSETDINKQVDSIMATIIRPEHTKKEV